MRELFAIYRRLAGAHVRSRLQYRASTIGRAATLALVDLVPILLVGLLFSRFRSVGGWRWPELAVLYGLSMSASAVARCFSWQLDHFEELIVSGEFDVFLTRPLSPLFHLLAVRFDVIQLGRLVMGPVVLLVAFHAAGVAVTPGHLALVAAAVAGGALLLFSLTLAIAALSFWHTRTGKLSDIALHASRAFAEFPITIYPRGVRVILTTVLPLALVTYHPALALLGRGTSPLAFAAIPTGALFLLLGLGVWRLGLRRYHSTGS